MSSAACRHPSSAHWTQAQRVADVEATGLLDTPPEERFDRLTALACEVVGTPVSLVTLIDDTRQFVKSAAGVGRFDVPRELALCDTALAEDTALIVEDASADPRFADNPLVTGDAHLRFYAGVVIRSPYGRPLGTLCVIDREPRVLADHALDHLKRLAALAEQEVARDFVDAVGLTPLAVPGEGLPSMASAVLALMTRRLAEAEATRVYLIRTVMPELHELDASMPEAGPRVLGNCLSAARQALPAACLVAATMDDEIITLVPDAGDEPAIAYVNLIHRAVDQCRRRTAGLADMTAWSGVAVSDGGLSLQRLMLRAGMMQREVLERHDPLRIAVFDADAERQRTRESALRQQLKTAISEDRIDVYFQPVVSVRDARIVGAEALCRWLDAPGGPVSPAEFVPMAERTQLIRPLSEVVLARVVREAEALIGASPKPLRLAVNIPGLLLEDDAFIGRLMDAQPRDRRWQLVVEITEHSFFSASERVGESIAALHSVGVDVVIDDFGTGHASFGKLMNITVAGVKLDRLFVRRIARHRADATILRGLIAMCRELSLPMVAEGVENPDQFMMLRHFGCHFAQGFLFDPALSPPDFLERLQRDKPYDIGTPLIVP